VPLLANARSGHTMPDLPTTTRRSVLGGALAGGLLAATSSTTAAATERDDVVPARKPGQKSMIGVPFEEHDVVRIGLIGLGNRGMGMLPGWAAVPGAQITAVCDIRADRAKKAADQLVELGKDRPAEYGESADSYRKLVSSSDVDFAYVPTPWELHGLWSRAATSQRMRKYLFVMENCSYGRNELAMLRMAHEGLFGDITNGHGGYLHDLRELLFSPTYYTDAWRRKWHMRSIASLYPMHGLAPIAACMDINRGDRFVTLRATSTEPKGLYDYRERFIPKDDPIWDETYINGDLVTC